MFELSIQERKYAFDTMVERWHEDEDTDLELHEYMGLTWEEYKAALERGGYV